MRLDEAVGVITATEPMGGCRRDGITARVDDVYSIKPMDWDTLIHGECNTRGRLVSADDYRPEGRLGPAVFEVIVREDTPPLQLSHLAIRLMPNSGPPTELLAASAIDAASMDSAARHLLDGTRSQSDRHDAFTPTARPRSAGPT